MSEGRGESAAEARPQQMRGEQHRSVRVIGCGRRFRRDDQVGLVVAEAIAALQPRQTQVQTTEAPCADLFDGLRTDDLLILVDAARAGSELPGGSLVRIDYRDAPQRIGQKCRTNTHTWSVDAALELGEQLGMLPEDVWIYAVAAEDFAFGDELSEPTAGCIQEAARRICSDIEAWLESGEPARA